MNRLILGLCLILFLSGCGGGGTSLPSFAFEPLEFPIADSAKILRMAAYHTPDWGDPGVFHNGIDLVIDTPQTPQATDPVRVVAPTRGVIREIRIDDNPYNPGQYMFKVLIRINKEWSVLLIFEPALGVGETQEKQSALITVQQNQMVNTGDDIGFLVDGEREYSHLHYMLERNGQIVCAYDYSSQTAKTIFDQVSAATGTPVSY